VCNILDDAADLLAKIRRLKSDLSNIIEPDYLLLDELLSLEVLTYRQSARIRSERTVHEQNDALLDLLLAEDQCDLLMLQDKCDKFVKALERTDQQHVANFIRQNGGQTHTLQL